MCIWKVPPSDHLIDAPNCVYFARNDLPRHDDLEAARIVSVHDHSNRTGACHRQVLSIVVPDNDGLLVGDAEVDADQCPNDKNPIFFT